VSVSLIDSLTHSTLSRDGVKLSRDDEMFIVKNVLMYHPDKEKKMAGQGNFIMVKH
jgi:DNA-directed RNA polymerase V subunit 1